jgi:hypothetical protein
MENKQLKIEIKQLKIQILQKQIQLLQQAQTAPSNPAKAALPVAQSMPITETEPEDASSDDSSSSEDSDSSDDSESSESGSESESEVEQVPNEKPARIAVPSGLNKNKRQAVSRMIDMRGLHVHFGGEDEARESEEDKSKDDSESVEETDDAQMEDAEEAATNVIHSEIRLYDSTFKAKSAKKMDRDKKYQEKVAETTAKPLSKGAKRRMRRLKLAASLRDGVPTPDESVSEAGDVEMAQPSSAVANLSSEIEERKRQLLMQVDKQTQDTPTEHTPQTHTPRAKEGMHESRSIFT